MEDVEEVEKKREELEKRTAATRPKSTVTMRSSSSPPAWASPESSTRAWRSFLGASAAPRASRRRLSGEEEAEQTETGEEEEEEEETEETEEEVKEKEKDESSPCPFPDCGVCFEKGKAKLSAPG